MGIENTVGGKALGMDRPLEGDDTPAPTGQWTVDRPERDGYHRVGDGTFHILVPTSILDVVLPLLNRAEAAPEPRPYWTDPDYQDWLNELMENAGDEWDDDVAMEDIAIRYVRDLERRAKAAPDLTALPTAEQVERARRSLWALAAEVPGDVYDDVKAAWQPVLAAVAALVRDTPDGDDG